MTRQSTEEGGKKDKEMTMKDVGHGCFGLLLIVGVLVLIGYLIAFLIPEERQRKKPERPSGLNWNAKRKNSRKPKNEERVFIAYRLGMARMMNSSCS